MVNFAIKNIITIVGHWPLAGSRKSIKFKHSNLKRPLFIQTMIYDVFRFIQENWNNKQSLNSGQLWKLFYDPGDTCLTEFMCEYKVPSLINMYFITGHCYYLVSKSHHHRKLFSHLYFPARCKSKKAPVRRLVKYKDKAAWLSVGIRSISKSFIEAKLSVVREKAKVAVCNFISLLPLFLKSYSGYLMICLYFSQVM